eukprot:scaffold270211_cov28-Tisochrysis_lutea.AAC.1
MRIVISAFSSLVLDSHPTNTARTPELPRISSCQPWLAASSHPIEIPILPPSKIPQSSHSGDKPAFNVVERFPVRDVVNHDDTVSAPVIRATNGAEALLPRSIPYLQLDALAIQLNCPNFLRASNHHGCVSSEPSMCTRAPAANGVATGYPGRVEGCALRLQEKRMCSDHAYPRWRRRRKASVPFGRWALIAACTEQSVRSAGERRWVGRRRSAPQSAAAGTTCPRPSHRSAPE